MAEMGKGRGQRGGGSERGRERAREAVIVSLAKLTWRNKREAKRSGSSKEEADGSSWFSQVGDSWDGRMEQRELEEVRERAELPEKGVVCI